MYYIYRGNKDNDMKKLIFAVIALFMTALLAQSQELKPVKDKTTKKFGYQDDSKNWVIRPIYDKAKKFELGVAIVSVDKLEGVIDTDGNLVLPFDCSNVKMDNKFELIHAERPFEVENPELYMDPKASAWGVYDLKGNEVFAPQFDSKAGFDKEGLAIVKSRATRKQGVVNVDGDVLIPLDYYFVSPTFNGYNALNDAMRIVSISKDFKTVSDDNNPESAPWMPVPYQTEGDLVRAFAYHQSFIGEKLYRNRIWDIEIKEDPEKTSHIPAITSALTEAGGADVEWGRDPGSFVRLEPVVDPDSHTGSFQSEVNGNSYTIQACLYDVNGNKIGNISEWGYLYARTSEGLLYMAEDEHLYFIAADVNWPGQSTAVNLTNCHPVDNSSFLTALGVNSSIINDMRDYWKVKQKFTDVELAEKTGYQSYYPAVPASLTSKEEKFLEGLDRKYPFLHRNYHQGQVFNIRSLKRSEADVTVTLAPEVSARYRDHYGNSLNLELIEPVFWGVHGDRYIRITPVPFKLSNSDREKPLNAHGMVDDNPESPFGVRFVFSLFEDDGTFVRTLGFSERITFGGHDVFGFEDIGWVFTRMTPAHGAIKFRESEPRTGLLSDLRRVDF